MDKIKNQLAGVAALLGVIAAIGGGFVKYGELSLIHISSPRDRQKSRMPSSA